MHFKLAIVAASVAAVLPPPPTPKLINIGSSDFLVKQGARWYPGRGQNWLVRRMQRSSLLNYRNRCQNLVGARRKHTRPHPHQAEPDQVPALQSAAYAAE